jgi:hypothetical protein
MSCIEECPCFLYLRTKKHYLREIFHPPGYAVKPTVFRTAKGEGMWHNFENSYIVVLYIPNIIRV